MRTALLQVKEELGAEAVIMSNKKVAGGVEIVAAIDGESNAAPTSQAHSLPNRGAAQPNRYSEQRQLPSSAAERYQDRRLDEDRISLNANSEKSGSMTQRFANMLKQYSGGAAESDDHVAENEDSLSHCCSAKISTVKAITKRSQRPINQTRHWRS